MTPFGIVPGSFPSVALAATVLAAAAVLDETGAFVLRQQRRQHHPGVSRPSIGSEAPASPNPVLFARPRSKWDDLVDDDDDDDAATGSETSSSSNIDIPIAPDMTYVERNVRRSHENFLSIRNIGGKEVCNDVYAKSPKGTDEVVWYVGKTAKVSDVSLGDCIARQWNLIETHATNLRPIELYPHRGTLELWTAPGDTELDVAYNRPEMVMTRMEKREVGPKDLKNNKIGFQGEVYQEGEEGFRSWRKPDGTPARPEINPGGETRPPTEEELEKLRADMQRQNVGVEDIYEEQQKQQGD